MTMRLYPSRFFTPPQITAEVVTEDKWHHSHSQPDKDHAASKAARYLVAALAGFVFTPLADFPGSSGSGDALASTVTTSVRFDKTIVYQDLAWTPLVAEVVTADKWLPRLSEPTRRITTRQQQDYISGPELPITTTLEHGWLRPLSEPTRVKVRQNEGSFVYPYQTIVAAVGDDTARPFTVTTSVRHDKSISVQDFAYAPYVEVAAEVITSDKWFAPFSHPVRAKPRLEGDYTAAPTQPQANDGIGWHRPFNEPTRRKTFLEGDVAFSPAQPEANDGIGWYSPFNQPTRRKPFLEGDTAYSPTLVEDASIQAKWFQPFGVPRAAKRVPEFPAYFYSPYFVPPISGVGTEFNWWPNLSERLRQRRPVAQQQAVIQGPQSPITVTLEYAWHRPLSEPVRRKAEAQTAGARFDPFPIPQVTLEYAWHRPLSEPTRRTVSRQTAGAVFHPFPQITIAWHQALSLPVRRKRQAQTAGAAFIYAPAQPGVGVGTDQPWPPLAEPVRFRLGLKPWQQQHLVYYPLLLSSDLDPACRVIDVFGTGVVVPSPDDVVVTFGQSDLTPAADEGLIPYPGNTVKVKC
jgi:hypothetical protein